MPTYSLIDPETSKPVEVTMSVAAYGALERQIDADGYDCVCVEGRWLRRDYGREGRRSASLNWSGWPIESMAAAVAPEDVPAEMEHCRKHGVAVNFTKDGRAIFESHAHRKAALRAMGMTDKLGYG